MISGLCARALTPMSVPTGSTLSKIALVRPIARHPCQPATVGRNRIDQRTIEPLMSSSPVRPELKANLVAAKCDSLHREEQNRVERCCPVHVPIHAPEAVSQSRDVLVF